MLQIVCLILNGFSRKEIHWYQVYARPCKTTWNFLTVLHHFWHSASKRKIYRRL
jgi:hypothetical protein